MFKDTHSKKGARFEKKEGGKGEVTWLICARVDREVDSGKEDLSFY